jgi:gas vesicle protein
MKKRIKETIIGAVAVGAIGYVAGILTAPKKGSETRKDIKDAGLKTKAEAEKKIKKVYNELSDVLKQAEGKILKSKSKAKTELSKAVDQGNAVKGKVREVLSVLHDGDADDKDLKAVIEESSKALDHLKKYLQKDV